VAPLVEIDRIRLSYGDACVIRGLSLKIERGQIGCLLGPSGCGKTSVLRCIAGFEPIGAGTIRLSGTIVSGPGIHVAPEERRVGMVFQDYALFPHLTAAQNIGFGISSPRDRLARVDELLTVTGLTEVRNRYPHELSGGQQQRVSLARALARRPALLLLDEPFSQLDSDLREHLAMEVREILLQQGATALLVTHDQHEAFVMADQIGVMADGVIQQWGQPNDLYHRPANPFVADFVGQGVFLTGKLNAGRIETELGTFADEARDPGRKGETDVLVRPDDIVLDDDSPIKAVVARKACRGAEILYTLKLTSGATLLALLSSRHDYPIGSAIGIRLMADRLVIFSRV
jgi:iron(III) transport system ATP-binding protein